ncbi:MAG: DUF2442 domain-containing protein [Longimicrobiales bacterium]
MCGSRAIRVTYTAPAHIPQTGSSNRVMDVAFTDVAFVLRLADGCLLSVPLRWFPRLLAASPDVRSNWIPAGEGCDIHWPDIDQDFSVSRLLRGQEPLP